MHITLHSSQLESTFKLLNSEEEWKNVREGKKKCNVGKRKKWFGLEIISDISFVDIKVTYFLGRYAIMISSFTLVGMFSPLLSIFAFLYALG